MKPLEASVRSQLALFVEDFISAERLTDILPDLSEIDEASDLVATELVMRAIGLLSEYEMGMRLEDDLRRTLAADASWSSDKKTSFSSTPKAGWEIRVSVGAGTPLLAVSA